jgi:hypothetical protein
LTSTIRTENQVGKGIAALVFIFIFLANVLMSGGHLDWWDGMEAFLVTESMALNNSAKLHPESPTLQEIPFDVRYTVYSNKVIQTGNTSLDRDTIPLEPVYTVRSIFLSAIAVPFYYLAMALSVPPIELVGLFVNSLLISITSLVIFCFSIRVYHSAGIALSLSIIYGICSFVWPYHTSFWTQPLQALTLISSLYFLYLATHSIRKTQPSKQRPTVSHPSFRILTFDRAYYYTVLSGLFLGLSVFSHASSLIFVPGFVIYALISSKGTSIKIFVLFLSSLIATSSFVGLINYWRFGSFTEFGYGYFASLQTHNGWAGLIGLLISPGAGLIFFFPVSILLVLAARYMYSGNKGLLLICLYIIIVNWLHVGTLSFGAEPYSWSGAIAWGPRYFIPILPFIVMMIGQLLVSVEKMQKGSIKRLVLKLSLIGLVAAGFYVNLIGTLVWYQYGIVYAWDREQLSRFPNNIDIITWNPYHSPIVLHTKALLSDYVSTVDPARYENTSWYWISYGLAPCSFDSYIFCKVGIDAFILVLIIITLIGIILVRYIRFEKTAEAERRSIRS